MKKIYYIFICLLLIMIPLRVNAVSISGTSFSGASSVTQGDSFNGTFGVSVSGLVRDSWDSKGIYAVGFELLFDSNYFDVSVPTSYLPFNTVVTPEDGHYYVVSVVNDNGHSNKCADDYLFCGNYSQNINFKAKSNVSGQTTISTSEIVVFLCNVEDDECDLDDADTLTGSSQNITVNVNKKSVSTSSNSKPSNNDKNVTDESVEEKEEVSYNYLSSLEITDYKIKFTKKRFEYTITIDDDVNSIDVSAIPEVEGSEIVIRGADDLKKNGYKVEIDVNYNGSTSTYVINTSKKSLKEEDNGSGDVGEILNFRFKFNKKFMWYILGGVLLIILIVIIVILKNYLSNKNIDKKLDEL